MNQSCENKLINLSQLVYQIYKIHTHQDTLQHFSAIINNVLNFGNE